ncbi:unnamed protein product [Effrenium voratum]|nr:unnamed protein product [Effrenium voratum]
MNRGSSCVIVRHCNFLLPVKQHQEHYNTPARSSPCSQQLLVEANHNEWSLAPSDGHQFLAVRFVELMQEEMAGGFPRGETGALDLWLYLAYPLGSCQVCECR